LRKISVCKEFPYNFDQLFDFFGIVQKVTAQISILVEIRDPCIAQHDQMLRYVWLGNIKKIPDVVDACFAFEQDFDDVKADGMREGFENLDFLAALYV
jgi:hypothetical protein